MSTIRFAWLTRTVLMPRPASAHPEDLRPSDGRANDNFDARSGSSQGLRRLALAVVSGALWCGIATSCSSGGGHNSSVAQPTSAVPLSSALTHRSDNTSELAKTAAIKAVKRYERVLDLLSTDRHKSLDRLYRVATQPDVTDEVGFLSRFRAAHDRQRGGVRVVSIRVDKLKPAGQSKPALAEVAACLDVHQVRAYGRNGQSIVPKSRKRFYRTHLTLVWLDVRASAGWRVKKVSAREESACSG
jgi:hypothetical protein